MKYIFYLLVLSLGFVSCQKDESNLPESQIEGKWIIYNQEILGSSISGDGSYLTFSGGLNGTGTDYKASDTTTGQFTYSMDEEATQIVIVDTMSEGGNYNYTFDILQLDAERFRFTGNTGAFGDLKIEMNKE
jgi:hypothetical protein